MMSTHPKRRRSWPTVTATVLFVLLVISVIASAVMLQWDIFESIGTILFVSAPLAVLSGIFSILALCIGNHRVWSLIMLALTLVYSGWLIWLLN
jgi:hypothetical protein